MIEQTASPMALRAAAAILKSFASFAPRSPRAIEARLFRLAEIIDHKSGVAELLQMCGKLCNIAEAVGYCVGTWTPDHAELARTYVLEARDLIANAEGVPSG